jgi:hypothetical protein
VLGSSGFLDSDYVSESEQVARERELILETQSSSRTLRGLNMHESTQMDAQESVKSPRSMYLVHRSTRVAVDASSEVGAEVSSLEGEARTMNEMIDLETCYGGGIRRTSLTKREC